MDLEFFLISIFVRSVFVADVTESVITLICYTVIPENPK